MIENKEKKKKKKKKLFQALTHALYQKLSSLTIPLHDTYHTFWQLSRIQACGIPILRVTYIC